MCRFSLSNLHHLPVLMWLRAEDRKPVYHTTFLQSKPNSGVILKPWSNMRKETKLKACVCPIMTYALETSQMLEANEMKVLRKIVGEAKIE